MLTPQNGENCRTCDWFWFVVAFECFYQSKSLQHITLVGWEVVLVCTSLANTRSGNVRYQYAPSDSKSASLYPLSILRLQVLHRCFQTTTDKFCPFRGYL